MIKAPNRLTSLLHCLGVAGPARVRACQGTGVSKISRGSGASLRSLIATPLITFCALLTLSPGVARAEVPKLILDGTFGSAGATGIAVEQSTGDVYVAGFVNFVEGFTPGHVDKFSDTNALLPPSPFGEPPSIRGCLAGSSGPGGSWR